MSDDFVQSTVAAIARWHGIAPPNACALAAVADLEGVLAEFAAAREGMVFEDEPSSFEAALAATREPR